MTSFSGATDEHGAILSRLNRLTADLVSAAAGVGPETLDSMLATALEQIGEALGADRTTFQSFSQVGTNGAFYRTWHRRGATPAQAQTVTVPVAGRGGSHEELSIVCSAAMHWTSPLTDSLRPIADVLGLAVRSCEQWRELQAARNELTEVAAATKGSRTEEGEELEMADIIGESAALRCALARVKEVAPTDASVMLLGETGTGKELFARAVHDRSARRARPFVRVNCAALPATLIESELFGHERGAFTGAVSTRQGRFEVAHRGTLFLDEIGDLPAEVQAKLLRVLQEGEFERVGSSQSRRVDVRVVAATHHDMERAVLDGRFRADLYYRLNVYPIALPPLRERTEDLPRLVWYFINRRQRALNRKFTDVPAAVFAALEQHAWPGNVRELANVIERAMIHSPGGTLLLDEAPRVPPMIAGPAAPAGTLEAVERAHIEDALRRCRWRINGSGNAAEFLGLHPNTLRFRMKKLGIHRPPKPLAAVDPFRRRSA